MTKKLGQEENHGIRNTGTEVCKGHGIVYQRKELYDRDNRPENLEAEGVEEVNANKKGPYILNSEVKKAIKNMREKKATGDNCVSENVFKLLGEDGPRLMTVMIKNKDPRISFKLQRQP